MTRLHPDRDLRRRGVLIQAPSNPDTGDRVRQYEGRNVDRSGWARGAPATRVVHAYFHAIPMVPADLPTYAANLHGWFKLRSLTPDLLGDEFAVVGGKVDICPTDYNGTAGPLAGFPTGSGWGDHFGTAAHLVIGKNLPGDVGKWTYAPAELPSIAFGGGAENWGVTPARELISAANIPGLSTDADSNQRTEYLDAFPFPAGNYGEYSQSTTAAGVTTSNNQGGHSMRTRYLSFAGTASRVKRGERLDVSVVLLGAQLNNYVADATFVGYARASLVLAAVTPDSEFGA